ncbi:hypothetical protein MRX96_013263 [Rhipicephalus microplus]
MHSVQGEPQYYGDAQRSRVILPPVQTFPIEWTPSPTWAAPSPAGLCFLAERPWQAAALPSDRSFPRYYYEDGSGPVSEQTLNPESLSEPSKPCRVEFLSVVLGIAFSKLLLGIRLPIFHNSLSPYDITPEVTDDAFERRREIAPNTVGQRFIPRRVAHPDVDEKGSRRTTTGTFTRVRVAGRATNGRTARLLLMKVMTCPVTTPPVTAATTWAQEEDDVQLRRERNIVEKISFKEDVLDVPWYFHDKKCVTSSFPQGTCLSVGHRGVYRSWEECRRRCVLNAESQCDETPAAETGSPRQLRHPYFADMQALGGARCVNVTRRELKSHRCLIGSNQFDSLNGCGQDCVRS